MPWSSRIAIELWRGRRAASPRRLLRDKVLPEVLPTPVSPPLAEPLIDVGFCQYGQVGQVILEPVGVLLLVGQLLAHQGIEGRPDADVTEVGRVVPVRKEEPSLYRAEPLVGRVVGEVHDAIVFPSCAFDGQLCAPRRLLRMGEDRVDLGEAN